MICSADHLLVRQVQLLTSWFRCFDDGLIRQCRWILVHNLEFREVHTASFRNCTGWIVDFLDYNVSPLFVYVTSIYTRRRDMRWNISIINNLKWIMYTNLHMWLAWNAVYCSWMQLQNTLNSNIYITYYQGIVMIYSRKRINVNKRKRLLTNCSNGVNWSRF